MIAELVGWRGSTGLVNAGEGGGHGLIGWLALVLEVLEEVREGAVWRQATCDELGKGQF